MAAFPNSISAQQHLPSPGIQPSQPTPSMGRVDDVPLRSLQLDEVSSSAEQYERDKKLARQQEQERLQQRTDRLTFDVGKILQLSIDLNQAVESNPAVRPDELVPAAEKLEQYAHELRTTFSGHHVTRVSHLKSSSADLLPSGEPLQQSRECLQLALRLKQELDKVLDPKNRNTVAVAALKAPAGKSVPAPLMSLAERIELIAYNLRHAAPGQKASR